MAETGAATMALAFGGRLVSEKRHKTQKTENVAFLLALHVFLSLQRVQSGTMKFGTLGGRKTNW